MKFQTSRTRVSSQLVYEGELVGVASAVQKRNRLIAPRTYDVVNHRPEWSDPGASANEHQTTLTKLIREGERTHRALDVDRGTRLHRMKVRTGRTARIQPNEQLDGLACRRAFGR